MHCEIHTGHGNGKHMPITDRAASDVALDFNPSGLTKIEEVKALAAALLSTIEYLGNESGHDVVRSHAIAREKLQTGTMWAVKALVQNDHL